MDLLLSFEAGSGVLGEPNEYRNLLEPNFVRIWFTRRPGPTDTVLLPCSHYNPAALS